MNFPQTLPFLFLDTDSQIVAKVNAGETFVRCGHCGEKMRDHGVVEIADKKTAYVCPVSPRKVVPTDTFEGVGWMVVGPTGRGFGRDWDRRQSENMASVTGGRVAPFSSKPLPDLSGPPTPGGIAGIIMGLGPMHPRRLLVEASHLNACGLLQPGDYGYDQLHAPEYQI